MKSEITTLKNDDNNKRHFKTQIAQGNYTYLIIHFQSTSTIRPPVIHRGPSPQELIAHTQAIMQTALLKKQLEDQKERFMKKQQERLVLF